MLITGPPTREATSGVVFLGPQALMVYAEFSTTVTCGDGLKVVYTDDSRSRIARVECNRKGEVTTFAGRDVDEVKWGR
jgi:hypothetical protein